MQVSFYSLVRFIPDLQRHEPVNVGALFTVGHEVAVRFVEREDLAEERDAIRRFEELVKHLIASEQAEDAHWKPAEFLHRLAYRRFSHFEITEPRQMEHADPRPELLDGFTERLVRESSDDPQFAL